MPLKILKVYESEQVSLRSGQLNQKILGTINVIASGHDTLSLAHLGMILKTGDSQFQHVSRACTSAACLPEDSQSEGLTNFNPLISGTSIFS